MAEHLLGRGVVQTVTFAAHRLVDAQFLEPVPPPLMSVPPSHARGQDRVRAGRQPGPEHRKQALLPGHVGCRLTSQATISLPAAMGVDGREVRLGPATLDSAP